MRKGVKEILFSFFKREVGQNGRGTPTSLWGQKMDEY